MVGCLGQPTGLGTWAIVLLFWWSSMFGKQRLREVAAEMACISRISLPYFLKSGPPGACPGSARSAEQGIYAKGHVCLLTLWSYWHLLVHPCPWEKTLHCKLCLGYSLRSQQLNGCQCWLLERGHFTWWETISKNRSPSVASWVNDLFMGSKLLRSLKRVLFLIFERRKMGWTGL